MRKIGFLGFLHPASPPGGWPGWSTTFLPLLNQGLIRQRRLIPQAAGRALLVAVAAPSFDLLFPILKARGAGARFP